jgi:hypothetical protein
MWTTGRCFTTDGEFLGAWGELRFEAGQFVNPQHLAIDGEGFVYVSDEGRDRVQKFRAPPPLGSQREAPLPP